LHSLRQTVSILYNEPAFSPQNCPSTWGSEPPSNSGPGPTRFFNPNGISSGSAVFAGLTIVIDRPSVTYTHTHTNVYGLFSGTTRVSRCQKRNLLLEFYGASEDNRGRHTDHPVGRHSTRTNQPPTSNIAHFTPDALPAATFPLYPGLGQTPNMLACIANGAHGYPVAWVDRRYSNRPHVRSTAMWPNNSETPFTRYNRLSKG